MKEEVPRYNGKEKKKVSKDICDVICMFIVYVCLSVIIPRPTKGRYRSYTD
jgi:hypothetical protein